MARLSFTSQKIDEILVNGNKLSQGTAGQILEADGNGSVEWNKKIIISNVDIGVGAPLESGTLYFVFKEEEQV